jgi:two-component system cell cycle response regulator DivK
VNKRILVVEDQEDNRRILRDMLGDAGYELIEAESGEEALTAVEAQRLKLLLRSGEQAIVVLGVLKVAFGCN